MVKQALLRIETTLLLERLVMTLAKCSTTQLAFPRNSPSFLRRSARGRRTPPPYPPNSGASIWPPPPVSLYGHRIRDAVHRWVKTFVELKDDKTS